MEDEDESVNNRSLSNTGTRNRGGSDDDDDDNNDDEEGSAGEPSRNKRRRLEALASRRRRQQQQALRLEVLELATHTTTAANTGNPIPDNQNDDDEDNDSFDANYDDNDNNDGEQPADDEEEDDGEDLMDHAVTDYQRIAALDTYGTEGMDTTDTVYAPMSVETRAAADREISRRSSNRRGDWYQSVMDDNDNENEEDDEARLARRQQFQKQRSGSGRNADAGGDDDDGFDEDEEEEEEEDLDGDDPVNLEAFDVPLKEWIAQDRTRREIQRRFRKFLRHFSGAPDDPNHNGNRRNTNNSNNGYYEQAIRTMCASNASTLNLSYPHLMESEPILAYWLADAPLDMLQVLNEAATRHVVSLFPLYMIHGLSSNSSSTEIQVRIQNVPLKDALRDLRRHHLEGLVHVQGVVTRRSAVYPVLDQAYYLCTACQTTQGPFRSNTTSDSPVAGGSSDSLFHKPDQCPNCESGAALKLHPTRSVYRNVQRLNLQETPGSVPPGRVPRSKTVILTHDLMDAARPGEEVDVTGIYLHSFDAHLTVKSGFPVFGTYILANHVQSRADTMAGLSESDVAQIMALSRDPRIGERIVQSIAPSIFGQDFPKMALAMALFGGVPKHVSDKHRIRGDVNVLLLGDPGTAKSQLLKYAHHTAPRAVYSTGKGASAVGLTASVHKDPITREWTLEGGALVLADQGVCLIDEFDKMNEQDRTSIHEAMEQQSISISKAGIVTSLQARCSVIAAANPIGGRYDSSNTLSDNVELTDPILQRFDILCVLQDIVDPVADERLAQFVTSSHMRSVPTRDWVEPVDGDGLNSNNTPVEPARPDLIPQALLRKYIQYARTNIRPVLRGTALDREKVESLYVALRRESAASGGVPIAVRHIESIMRMAEAHAKMHLRESVRDDDLDASIRMMLGGFIEAQKFSVRRALARSFGKFMTSGQDRAHLLAHILQEMFRHEQMYQVIRRRQQRNHPDDDTDEPVLEVALDEFERRARERRVYDVTVFCRSPEFDEAGYTFHEHRGVISRGVV